MPKILCVPYNKELIQKIKDYEFIVYTQRLDELDTIILFSETTKTSLKCIKVELNNTSVSLLDIEKYTKNLNLPIHIFCGYLKDHTQPNKLASNIRVYLDADVDENIDVLLTLSQKGIHCGLSFEKKENINWKKVNMLLQFYLKNKNEFLQIEPFHSIIKDFKKRTAKNFNRYYFNDYEMFLHINNEGKVFCSIEDMKSDKSNINIDQSDWKEKINEEIGEKRPQYHRYFLDCHECCSCIGWNMCRATFENNHEKEGCKELFNQLYIYLNQLIEDLETSTINEENHNF